MRVAFSGDASGWKEKKNKKGEVVYQNSETKEITKDKPEVLVVAEAMQQIEQAERDHEELVRLRERNKEMDVKIKRQSAQVNVLKGESQENLRAQRAWEAAAREVLASVEVTKAFYEARVSQLESRVQGQQDQFGRLLHAASGINHAADEID